MSAWDTRSLFTTDNPNNPTTYTVNVTSTGAVNGANGVLNLARAAPSAGSWTHDLVVKAVATAVSGTNPTLVLKVQESSTSNFASDIRDVASLGLMDPNKRVACAAVRITKQYVRLYATVGGTSPSFTIIAGLVPDMDQRCSAQGGN